MDSKKDKYACPCGINVKNSLENLHQHFQTATHQYFLATGISVPPIEVNEDYPPGHWKRSQTSRLRAMKRYAQRKRDEKKQQLLIQKSTDEALAIESLSQDKSCQMCDSISS